MKYELTFKPSGMSAKRNGRVRPEYVTIVDAIDRLDAVAIGREIAIEQGFNGYALTDVKEIYCECP